MSHGSFEPLPIPEAVDRFSAAAADKWLARRRARGDDDSLVDDGVLFADKTGHEILKYLKSRTPGREAVRG